jgi:ABC-type glutathione transport system ATPase component
MSGYSRYEKGDMTLRNAVRQLMEETRKEVTDRVIREVQAAVRSTLAAFSSKGPCMGDDLKRRREVAEKELQRIERVTETYITPSRKRLKEEVIDLSLEFSEEI